jgi:methionyl-tRNA synthetase
MASAGMTHESKECFYITTAINYTNGPPHFGHAYEAIVGDCIARYHRAAGRDVFFLTGADEHGQKVAETATSQSLSPIELCDKCVTMFQEMNRRLSISNDGYIRTTSLKHKLLAQQLWRWVATSGDIYLGSYEGWYSKREERFLTETEASAANYLDGSVPLTKTSEPSYFFRMSKYQQPLVDYISDHPEFIFPPERRREILERLKEPLLDLSISRTSFDWGIPIPDDFNGKEDDKAKHVMYVWFDALTNYLSGIGWPLASDDSRFWPAVHLIGKDIVWFHAVVWPCMLMSADIRLPRRIVCHGFINGPDDRKMSKSWGNVVDPMAMLDKYPNSDIIRYFVLREGSFGNDLTFNETSLRDRNDWELAANLGNLGSRTFSLVQKECDSITPSELATPLFSVKELARAIEGYMTTFQIQSAITSIFGKFSEMNEWLAKEAPWLLKGEEHTHKRRGIIRTLIEGIYILAHFLEPFLPITSSKIYESLGTSKVDIPTLTCDCWSFVVPGTRLIPPSTPLFPRLDLSRFEKKTL